MYTSGPKKFRYLCNYSNDFVDVLFHDKIFYWRWGGEKKITLTFLVKSNSNKYTRHMVENIWFLNTPQTELNRNNNKTQKTHWHWVSSKDLSLDPFNPPASFEVSINMSNRILRGRLTVNSPSLFIRLKPFTTYNDNAKYEYKYQPLYTICKMYLVINVTQINYAAIYTWSFISSRVTGEKQSIKSDCFDNFLSVCTLRSNPRLQIFSKWFW